MNTKNYKLLCVLLCLLILLLVAYILGFRITYSPDLVNNWDAISGCAAWAGVFASFLAIWIAIQVPKQIAVEQNKIALFQKKYDCYGLILSLLACGDQIANKTKNIDVQQPFKVRFDSAQNAFSTTPVVLLTVQLKQKESEIVSGAFLFSNYNVELLQEILDTGIDLLNAVSPSSIEEFQNDISQEAMIYKEKYCKLCQSFKTKYCDSMEKELSLTIK